MGARFQCLGNGGTSAQVEEDVDRPDGGKENIGRDGSGRRPHDGNKWNDESFMTSILTFR